MPVEPLAIDPAGERHAREAVALERKAAAQPARTAAPGISGRRWGVILAGGDGTRLRPLTRFVCGDDRPKQFCALVGADTLLEQTRQRAERSIPAEQLLIPLTKNHRDFYLQESSIRASQRIVQPANKGTAPPILHSLLSIEGQDRDAVVAILPCDHHYSHEPAFTSALESAFDIAGQRPGSVVLLGATPQSPEVEYGWIELGQPLGSRAFCVQGFCEKPSLNVARQLLEREALWNTFVMVGRVDAFLGMMNQALADLVDMFHASPLWTGAELNVQESLYDRIQPVNFSHEVLSVQTGNLVALQLQGTDWNDLGHPERLKAVLDRSGAQPRWMAQWMTERRAVPLESSAVA